MFCCIRIDATRAILYPNVTTQNSVSVYGCDYICLSYLMYYFLSFTVWFILMLMLQACCTCVCSHLSVLFIAKNLSCISCAQTEGTFFVF